AWSPDGTRLLFSSDRTGTPGLWAVQMAAGKAAGMPGILKADLGSHLSSGITKDGVLFLFKRVADRALPVADVDWTFGTLSSVKSFQQGYLSSATNPSWSPDGKYIAYAAGGGAVVAVRTVATGDVRRVPHSLQYVRMPQWSPDGKWLLVVGRDSKGRDGVF